VHHELDLPVHVCIGHEIAPVRVLAALTSSDKAIAIYRGYGWALSAGMPVRSLFAEVMARATGINGGRAGSPYFTAPDCGFLGEKSIVDAGWQSQMAWQ
jgi:TPP-dependent pyruvate/acetoin dehydrogenase alpha subunit